MPHKAPNYSARAGQIIAGNLGRSASGQFVRAASGGSESASSSKKKRLTPAERRAARQAEQEQKRQERDQAKQQERRANEAKVGDGAGLGKNLSDALLEFDNPDEVIALNPHNAEELERKGLIERGADGRMRMSAAGRAYTSAARSGDVSRARDALSKGGDTTAKRQAREERRAEVAARRQQRQAERESKPKGGKGAASKPAVEQKPEKPAEFTPTLIAAAQQLSSGTELPDADQEALLRNGLARLDKDGMPMLTATGRRAIRQKSVALPGSLHIFKDARQQWRWLAISSTAFRDRDGEIVATKALEADCARADQDGDYGSLRWWHEPTLNLGDCDFNGMSGRSLIESGTFRSEAIAHKVAAHASNLEVSIGFYRRSHEPDANGVYHTIRRFERSLCPLGTASNVLTSFIVKESAMALNDIKRKALAALGFGDQEIADIEAQAATKEKAADEAGIAYKAELTADGMIEPTADADPDGDDDFIGDMSPADFVALLTPLIAEAVASAIGAKDAQTIKAAEDTTRDQELQALQEQQRQFVAQQEALTKQQDELATRLKALDGDQPTGLPTGYRASQDARTILDSEIAKSQRPIADPLLVAADLILAT